jgi:YkoY family integral membrane protein
MPVPWGVDLPPCAVHLGISLMLAYVLWGQEFGWGDLGLVGLLVLLEGVLSIDNALVLGLLAKRLPKEQRSKALTYGLVGAFAFRFLAIAVATFLLKWRWVKLLGGGYLAYIAIKHLFFEAREEHHEHIVMSPEGEPVLVRDTGEPLSPEEEEQELEERTSLPLPRETSIAKGAGTAKFWPTVLVIELTDIAFAVDSILAALGVVGSAPADHPKDAFHPKLWVIITGGILGVILMRFAAVIFIRLLERFPRFEMAAYMLVAVIGGKLLVDWWFNTPEHPHTVNFHAPGHVAFWIFWVTMLACFLTGFLPSKTKSHAATAAAELDDVRH